MRTSPPAARSPPPPGGEGAGRPARLAEPARERGPERPVDVQRCDHRPPEGPRQIRQHRGERLRAARGSPDRDQRRGTPQRLPPPRPPPPPAPPPPPPPPP